MNEHAVHYVVLRDQRDWDGVTLTGLQPQADGALTLERVPAPVGGQSIALPAPFDPEPSGSVFGFGNDFYISDTANNRVIRIDGMCGARMVLPGSHESGPAAGQFRGPRGLAVGPGSLYVADSGNARIQVFRLPTLELHASWQGLFQEPTDLAIDSQKRIYVLDRGRRQVLRFNAWGVADDTYNAAMAQQLALASPMFLAIGGDDTDTLYISDDHSRSVLSFDAAGKALPSLPSGTPACPARPGALAAGGGRLYVADAASGSIWVFDLAGKAYLGTAFNFLGPVAAMALDQVSAKLYIKPGADETTYQLQIDGAYVPFGSLSTQGPLDAGEGCEWERAHVEVEVPAGTDVALRTFVGGDPTVIPGNSDWTQAPTLDILIPPLPGIDDSQPGQKRYLWLQVQLKSPSQQASPVLTQVQAETTAESYLDHLPAVYRREDLPRRFLERWLALFRSELGDVEALLDEMPRRFDPATTPENCLPWLADWLAFELPEGAQAKDAPELRKLLLRAHAFFKRRATPLGLREMVHLYAGVKPHVFEAFRQRHVWQLGNTSLLGFDTALPPADPDGMIIPGLIPADPQYLGLTGEYYAGINFDELKLTATDAVIHFGGKGPDKGPPFPQIPSDPNLPGFSVRWTGQVQPRYSERYDFHVRAQDGVKLWVDYELLINTWSEPQSDEQTATINLTAGRWYALTLEYYKRGPGGATGDAEGKLSWSSRSQRIEVVPQARLYSVLDDTANLDVPSQVTGCESISVGQTVIGASGPMTASEFGIPLFSETAHLFTVSIPAGQVPSSAQRGKVKQVIEAEKPAHSDFHLCFVEPRMRVGFQARVGIDSIVAGPAVPMELAETVLGLDSVLVAEAGEGRAGRVGRQSRLGEQTFLG